MRTLTILFALGTVASVTGCATQGGNGLGDQKRAYTEDDFNAVCRDREVTFNYVRKAAIDVYPPLVEMCRGNRLTIRIVPPVDPGMHPAQSSSFGDNPGPSGWLNGTSTDGMTIALGPVPQSARDGQEYEYSISVQGIGSVDPTVRIVH